MTNMNDIKIERVLDAKVEDVWNAWTDEEMAKKWWGPEGFSAPSIKIDLRIGGKYIFAMHGPKDSEWDKDMYSAGVYKEIEKNKKLVVTDYFSDSNGNMLDVVEFGMDVNFPKESIVTVLFESISFKTKLSIIYPKPLTKEQFDAMKNSGLVEGWNSSINKLELILK